jgi:hypothetical protein
MGGQIPVIDWQLGQQMHAAADADASAAVSAHAAGVSAFLPVHWVAVPKALGARRVNRRRRRPRPRSGARRWSKHTWRSTAPPGSTSVSLRLQRCSRPPRRRLLGVGVLSALVHLGCLLAIAGAFNAHVRLWSERAEAAGSVPAGRWNTYAPPPRHNNDHTRSFWVD